MKEKTSEKKSNSRYQNNGHDLTDPNPKIPDALKGLKFYTIKQVAQILSVCERTVQNYIKKGWIKDIIKFPSTNGKVLIPEKSLIEFLESGFMNV